MRYNKWSDGEINKHIIAARLLDKIKDEAFKFIRERVRRGKEVSELDVEQFLFSRFDKYGLKTNGKRLIVAFNESAAEPHYNCKKEPKMLKKGSLILIDIWARLKKKDSPYADITWMGRYGKITNEMKRVCELVFMARDESLKFVEREVQRGKMPKGREIDRVARDIIDNSGYKGKFIHTLGHSIGFNSPHGKYPNLGPRRKSAKPLLNKIGYTIEPGIYLEGKFGVRTEIDFIIINGKVNVTTPIQENVVVI